MRCAGAKALPTIIHNTSTVKATTVAELRNQLHSCTQFDITIVIKRVLAFMSADCKVPGTAGG